MTATAPPGCSFDANVLRSQKTTGQWVGSSGLARRGADVLFGGAPASARQDTPGPAGDLDDLLDRLAHLRSLPEIDHRQDCAERSNQN
ncbi:hypothetical protein L3Q65_06675 [Amycolatopsis sp. FU40]|uniref:hypothetical protein n=1 Tax=Amycolatopsis sp. FU40 TaxID=2914159 RepID=UPI001F39EA99|nr:hypothetical protein [Amycolatopsis sp. FU40]UKD56397.1 hypothetical protein L3Q65_06675 [Amycolatopsis sp. FU40]